MEEELLEPVARFVRFGAGLTEIPKNHPLAVADIGCGPKMRFLKFAHRNSIKIERYVGIDPLIDEKGFTANRVKVDLKKQAIDEALPLEDNSVDLVVGFAVLEHVDKPQEIVEEAFRILKPGGRAVFTTPSWKAKKILEFLSFKLGIISPREIEEHKTYFNQEQLMSLAQNLPSNSRLTHKYFEFGLNNLFTLQKK